MKLKKKFSLPKTRLGRTALCLLVTAVFGLVYFYVSLPLQIEKRQYYMHQFVL